MCGKCPVGQFAATNGSVACTDCPAGSVASQEGMVSQRTVILTRYS